jgi:Amidase
VDDLTALPAHRLAELVRAREVSAAEVLAAHLDRLEAVNPRLNAVVEVAPDAVDRAAAADAALARGEDPGPLHGVPFTAKDNLETRGVVTAIGCRSGRPPSRPPTPPPPWPRPAEPSPGPAPPSRRPPRRATATPSPGRSGGPTATAWRDDLALALAAHLESTLGGWHPPPG